MKEWTITSTDPYDESDMPIEAGYYRIIDKNGEEKVNYYYNRPVMRPWGVAYWHNDGEIRAWKKEPIGVWEKWNDVIQCSECGFGVLDPTVFKNRECIHSAHKGEPYYFKFCPECGAVVFQQGELDLGRITK